MSRKTYKKRCVYCKKRFTSKTEKKKLCSAQCRYFYITYGGKFQKKEQKKKCKYCGEEFVASYRHTQFCSSNCNGKFHYHRTSSENRKFRKRKCKSCGDIFKAYRSDKVFCSKDCQWHYRYITKRKVVIKVKCKGCKQKFIRKYGSQKYCSRRCCAASHSRNSYNKRGKYYPQLVKRPDGSKTIFYRYIVEQSIKRRLLSTEYVHHIDMDSENNKVDNLHVFKSNSKHMEGHSSLNWLVKGLLRKGVIGFNRKKGVYFMAKK